MPRILICGLVAADLIFTVDRMPTRADKYRAQDLCLSVGGGAANAAIAIQRLGGQAVLAGRLGDDAMGDLVYQRLSDEGVDLSLLQRLDGARSSTSAIFIDADGERQIMNYRGDDPHEGVADALDDPHAAWLAAQWQGDDAPRIDAVLVDGRWIAGATVVLDAARRLAVPSVLDAEQPVTEALVQAATHVAFSRQGLADYTGKADRDEGLRLAAARVPGRVCVTDGERGVYVVSRQASGAQTASRQTADIEHVAGYRVDVVDTLGAGDAWHGAFTLALASGVDEHDAVHRANAVAALKCTRAGGSDGAPYAADVEVFMEAR